MSEPALLHKVSSPSKASIYLDHHATTPVDPRVVDVVTGAMLDDYGRSGNGSSHGAKSFNRKK